MDVVDVVRLDVSEEAKDLARELIEEEPGEDLPCFVRHRDAGGQCERPAVMRVYGLRFCEVHGEEARIGALMELYDDATLHLERLDNRALPPGNPEAVHLVGQMKSLLFRRDAELEKGEEAALVRAYPEIPEFVCAETRSYDYGVINDDLFPEDIYKEARAELHGFMRQAYEKGLTWLVEELELKRESASAQASFAIRDRERKTEAIKAR